MDKYFYLIAQMPFLAFGVKSYMSREFFLQECAKWQVSLADIEASTFMRSLRAFEDGLLEGVLQIRLGARPEGVFAGSNPLEVEKNILLSRWQFIEEHSLNHQFDITAVAAYLAKLEILESYFVFDKNKGLKNFDQICEAVL
jgi:hypothetical protein